MVTHKTSALATRWSASVMKTTLLVLACLAITVFWGNAHAASFQVHAAVADSHGRIEPAYVYDASGCRGKNHVPSIRWSDAPAGTHGYAVTVYDPDASGGWWHWIVVDIPASSHQLGGSTRLPQGALALRNSFGQSGWDGPCPPVGDPPHHYVFTVHALDSNTSGLAADATPVQAMAAIHAHTLAAASVVYTYGR